MMLSWLPWVRNSEASHRGFKSGEKHWSNHKCKGSGQPTVVLEYRGTNGFGACGVCGKVYRVTFAGTVWNHKKRVG